MDAIDGNNNSKGGGGNPTSEDCKTTWGGGGNQYVPLPPAILQFAEERGMHACQVNAQRYFGPPIHKQPGWTPEPGTEVFLGRLPRYMDERELIPFLEQGGPIYQLRLLMDFSGTNKGYGFVQYFTPNQADQAIGILHRAEIRPGIRMVACRSVDNRRLILGGVPTNKTADQIYTQVKAISDGVLSVHLTWSGRTYQTKGLVYVVFDSHRAAALARKVLMNKAKPVVFWDHPITVDWAEPEISIGNRNQQQVLRVRNLTSKTSTSGLRRMFTQESCNGVKKMKRINNQAYVYFGSRCQAEAAKLALNGLVLAGKSILVDWMNPKFVPKTAAEKQKMERRRQPKQNYGQSPEQQCTMCEMIQQQEIGLTTGTRAITTKSRAVE